MTPLVFSYRLAIICFILQFALLAYGSFSSPDITINGAYDVFIGGLWTLIKAIPWLVLLPGLVLGAKRIMAWMSYVCLVYFIIWMLAVFGETQSNQGHLGVLVTLIQFSAAVYYTRINKQHK